MPYLQIPCNEARVFLYSDIPTESTTIFSFNTNAITIIGIKERKRNKFILSSPFQRHFVSNTQIWVRPVLQTEIAAFISSSSVTSYLPKASHNFLHLFSTKHGSSTADNQEKWEASTDSVKSVWYLCKRIHCRYKGC